jgi:hypothetical protein
VHHQDGHRYFLEVLSEIGLLTGTPLDPMPTVSALQASYATPAAQYVARAAVGSLW